MQRLNNERVGQSAPAANPLSKWVEHERAVLAWEASKIGYCVPCYNGSHDLCLRSIDAYEFGKQDEAVCRCSVCFPKEE